MLPILEVPPSIQQGLLAYRSVFCRSEKFEFAKGQITFGQRLRAVTREVFGALLRRAQERFEQGQSWEEVLGVLMPA